jgi:hypothetical protein
MDRRRGQVEVVARPVRFITQVRNSKSKPKKFSFLCTLNSLLTIANDMNGRRGQVEVVARPVRFVTQVQGAHHHHGNLATVKGTVLTALVDVRGANSVTSPVFLKGHCHDHCAS